MDGHRPLDGPSSDTGYHPVVRHAAQIDADLDGSGGGQQQYSRLRREQQDDADERRPPTGPVDHAITDEPTPLLLQALMRASLTGEDLSRQERDQIRALRGHRAYSDITTTRFYRLHQAGHLPPPSAPPSEPGEALEPRIPDEDPRAD